MSSNNSNVTASPASETGRAETVRQLLAAGAPVIVSESSWAALPSVPKLMGAVLLFDGTPAEHLEVTMTIRQCLAEHRAAIGPGSLVVFVPNGVEQPCGGRYEMGYTLFMSGNEIVAFQRVAFVIKHRSVKPISPTPDLVTSDGIKIVIQHSSAPRKNFETLALTKNGRWLLLPRMALCGEGDPLPELPLSQEEILAATEAAGAETTAEIAEVEELTDSEVEAHSRRSGNRKLAEPLTSVTALGVSFAAAPEETAEDITSDAELVPDAPRPRSTRRAAKNAEPAFMSRPVKRLKSTSPTVAGMPAVRLPRSSSSSASMAAVQPESRPS